MMAKRFKGEGPFDDSASTRLVHMGLLAPNGSVEKATTEALSKIMAGLFFDMLCDWYNDIQTVKGVYTDLGDYHAAGDYRRLLLRYSLQYDMLHEPLPTAVWWMTGNEDLVRVYLERFMVEMGRHVKELMEEVGTREEVVRQ